MEWCRSRTSVDRLQHRNRTPLGRLWKPMYCTKQFASKMGAFATCGMVMQIVGGKQVFQELTLPTNRQVVSSVDHRFALSNPALVSAPSKTPSPAPVVRSSRGEPWDPACPPKAWCRQTRQRPAPEIAASLRDLVRMRVKLFRQLDQRFVAFERR